MEMDLASLTGTWPLLVKYSCSPSPLLASSWEKTMGDKMKTDKKRKKRKDKKRKKRQEKKDKKRQEAKFC